MAKEILKKGDQITLPVKSISRSFKYSLYIVEYQGKEFRVKMFPFQETEPQPEKIKCWVKDVTDEGPFFVQLFKPVYEKFYKIGNNYTFFVKTDHTNAGYYELTDEHNFIFRIYDYGNNRLYVHQPVECKVTDIHDTIADLQFIRICNWLPFKSPDELLENINLEENQIRILKYFLEKSPILVSVRQMIENRNSEWILETINRVDEYFSELLSQKSNSTEDLLNSFKKLCLYLLEESSFLENCKEFEQNIHRNKLSSVIQHIEDYSKALEYIKNNTYRQYASQLLSNLEKSNYLYQPERRLLILACILSLKQDIIGECMFKILNILQDDKHQRWIKQPYRGAFLQMLEAYISNESNYLNHVYRIEKNDKQRVNQIIKALAIELLIVEEKNDEDNNRRKKFSMLYRYASLLLPQKAEILLKKATACLTEDFMPKIAFGWKDLNVVTFLCEKLVLDETPAQLPSGQYFEAKNARIALTGKSIQISPIHLKTSGKKAIPDRIFPKGDITIFLNDGNFFKAPAEAKDLSEYQRMWNSITPAIFNDKYVPIKKVKPEKANPEIGDIVNIIVDKRHPVDYYKFYCHIEDENYKGYGTLNVKDITNWNIRNVGIEEFYSEDEKPYLIAAQVIELNDEGYKFALQDLLSKFICENTQEGLTLNCRITGVSDHPIHGNTKYLMFTEYGYGAYMFCKQNLSFNDIVKVTIKKINYNNAKANIQTEFVKLLNEDEYEEEDVDAAHFDVRAFYTLLSSYCDEKVFVSNTETEQEEEETNLEENIMQTGYVDQLMHIIDYKSVIANSWIETYNYQSVAKIVANMLDNNIEEEYFAKRLELIKVPNINTLQAEFDKFDKFPRYPDIWEKTTQLIILNRMDKPFDPIMVKLLSCGHENIENLAKLVTSYNLLAGFDMAQPRQQLKIKIKQLLNLQMELPETFSIGSEDQFTEFKTSIVYPPENNMQPNLNLQIVEIVKVVCGFLNAHGGNLYIGVDDRGIIKGLDADFRYFAGSTDYDIQTARDKFDRKFRDNINSWLGLNANTKINAKFITTEDNITYYHANIEPSQDIVYCNSEIYVRTGSSTRKVDDTKKFLHDRPEQYQKIIEKQ